MRPYTITTLWVKQRGDDQPWLLEFYDEALEEEHDGVPDFFTEHVEQAGRIGDDYRILRLTVDYDHILAAFAAESIPATIES